MPAESTANALGVELARAVRTQAEASGTGLSEFARALSLDVDRLHVELTYLSILTMQFALGVSLGAGADGARVATAFERELWSGQPWRASAGGLAARARAYRDAFNHPHPELGRAYGIGRTFARHCNCSHELAAIECGAKAYMEQLPRMLELLRGLTVVSPPPTAAAR